MVERRLPTVARRITELRLAAGMTQQELAVKAGLSISNLSQIEQGKRKDPRISTVSALAAALGVDVTELLRESSSRQQKKK
jgi:XRE family transcriptional regulator, fatty acid utilization regulator